MSENEEFIREFLEECTENLDQLDQDLVALESAPQETRLLENIFRTIHTIKGTSGFFGFSKLGSVTHDGESLLGRLRDGELLLNQQITTSLLKLVDCIRGILSNIQDTGEEGAGDFQALSAELIRLALSPGVEPQPSGEASAESGARPMGDDKPGDAAELEPPVDNLLAVPAPPTANPELAPDDPITPPSTPPSTPTVASPTPSATAATPFLTAAIPSLTAATPTESSVTTAVASEGSIRVDVGLLDDLVDLAGELVLARNQLNQFGVVVDDRALTGAMQKLSLITSELQEGVLQTRMQPIATIWGKFPRLVRDLAVNCNKEVRLAQEGEETELDRTLLEAIKDPLTHLIRNAVDHGIESPTDRESRDKPRQGCIVLRAYHESGQVHIGITDDGGGIDIQRVRQRALDRGVIAADQADLISDHELCQLIFRPGFSTAEKVTDVSGRGVGMDVVRTNIEQIGGTIDLQNRPGQGTTVQITIPLTLAIIPALIITCGGDRFAIPQPSVAELLHFDTKTAGQVVEWIHEAPVCRLRGKLLPLVYLSDVLQLSEQSATEENILNIVVLQAGGGPFGLVVDEVINTEEIVVKPIGRMLQAIPVFAGATIMGDGTVALILDVGGLSREIGQDKAAREQATDEADQALLQNDQMVLCELDAGRRIAIRMEDVERLEEFSPAQIEYAAGMQVVQYGDTILPLIDVARILGQRVESPPVGQDLVRVVVGRRGSVCAGLVVEHIIDIVERPPGQTETVTPGQCVERSVVIAGRVTDVIDLDTVLREAGVPWVESASGAN